MKGQLKSMGLSLDWDREIATCNPDYYAHQQRIFLDLLKKGLAYRQSSKVNWDPVDNTVLANEQVIDGRGWRSGALVEQRELTQWFFKITDYSDELLEALGTLDKWPEKVRLMQANWIGRSEGMLVRWALDKKTAPKGQSELEIYTTRPDTLFGASFMAIAPDHPLAKAAAETNPALAEFCERVPAHGHLRRRARDGGEAGFDTGIRAVHPFDKDWLVPVYVANFILMDYGTGAIFGCPSGDQRDLDFARKYDLPVVPVILPPDESIESFKITDTAYDGHGTMINSRFLDDLSTENAFEAVAKRLEAAKLGGKPVGQRKVNYRLRDWGISRQRYWGCPIPVIHCEDCGVVPVPEKDLPVKLPEDATFDKPGNPLDRHPTWKHVQVPDVRQGGDARDGHHGHVRRQLVVLRALHGARRQDPGRQEGGGLLAAGRPVHRRHRARDPASALFALLLPRHVRHRARDEEPARAVRGAVHAGHGHARDLQVGGAAAGCCRPRSASRATATRAARSRSRPASRPRSARSRRCRSRRRTSSTPTTSSPHSGADCARWFMLSDSPPERDVIWTEAGVQGAGRFIQRVWRLVDDGGEGRAKGHAHARGAWPGGDRIAPGGAQGAPCRGPEHRGPALQRRRGPDLRVHQCAFSGFGQV